MPPRHMLEHVSSPWKGRCWNVSSFIGGTTRLPPPSSLIMPICLPKNTPTDGEIRVAVAELTSGRIAGVLCMRAEHLKEWLQGAKLEEDLKTEPTNVGAGKEWDTLVQLVQAIWEEGKMPTQLGWVVTVLIPKGDGDYHGICLLEPIWKVTKRVMDKWLEAIALHDSLHGCHNRGGIGTAPRPSSGSMATIAASACRRFAWSSLSSRRRCRRGERRPLQSSSSLQKEAVQRVQHRTDQHQVVRVIPRRVPIN